MPNGGYYYENNDYMGFYGMVDGPCGNRDIHFTCHLLFLFEGSKKFANKKVTGRGVRALKEYKKPERINTQK